MNITLCDVCGDRIIHTDYTRAVTITKPYNPDFTSIVFQVTVSKSANVTICDDCVSNICEQADRRPKAG